jgi:hypothetical protein
VARDGKKQLGFHSIVSAGLQKASHGRWTRIAIGQRL